MELIIILKIIIAGIAGTAFMTAFSYLISSREKEQYREPELLNSLIDRSENLPDMSNTRKNPIGWLAHFGIGIIFMIAYKLLWPEALRRPTLVNILLLGTISGVAGIIAWKVFFSNHANPPKNNRMGYYVQLFVAHLIFTAVSILAYKYLEFLD